MLVITSFVRSGSTALGEQLGTSDLARHFGEVFHQQGYEDGEIARKFRLCPEANFFRFCETLRLTGPPSLTRRHREWHEFTRHLLRLSDGVLPIIDVKYNSWHHLNPVWHGPDERPFLLTLLREYSEPTIIHLRRRNLLLQAASELIAIHSDLWHSPADAASGESVTPLSVSPDSILRRMRDSRDQTRIVGRWLAAESAIELTYEDTFAEDGTLAARAIEQLQAAGLGAVLSSMGEPSLRKLGRDPSRWIANWDSIVEAASKIDFEAPL